jgi:3-oxoacid CoA-transferase subunit A
MSILLSGDFHGNAVGELSILTRKYLRAKYGPQKYQDISCHVILGDGGFLWPGNEKADACNYRAFGARHFPVLSVIGNHEPMLGMTLPEADIGIGEKVFLVNKKPLVAYLKRGGVYQIEGYKLLVLGGALSIDQEYRLPGRSWWKEEYWSGEEKERLFELLAAGARFDYVLAHTGPDRVNLQLFHQLFPGSSKFTDEVAQLNDVVDSRIDCRGWFCGHWHQDRLFTDRDTGREYRYLYRDVHLLEGA